MPEGDPIEQAYNDGYAAASVEIERLKAKVDQLQLLLIEADRLLALEGTIYDPGSLRAQIAQALANLG